MIEVADQLRDKLKEVFGYNQFRGDQEAVIKNVLAGKNTFVIMPTGAGKSLCYQLPALMVDGTAIVVSPLIALMKNQVDQLRALGVNAKFLNSTLTKAEINRVKKETLSGEIKLLYVAPESLTKEENIAFLKQAKLSFAAIDEAHCISEWGHDFRPEYRRIRAILQELGDLPIIALTATATPKVKLDIVRNLQMEEASIFKSSFNRKNLYYEVRPKEHPEKQLIKFLNNHRGSSGVIYCLSRKKVQEIAEFLNVNDFSARPYHAGLDSAVRMKNQDDFLNEEVDIIVATIAFGMGIDKPDVRFVIHYDVPKSLEGYYQETGRAGRDGLEGHCLMFYKYDDIIKLEKFNKDKPVTERENSKLLLDEMASYAESSVCRRKQLLHYFGETHDESHCGKTMWCDACMHPKEKFEGKEFVLIALQAAQQTKERFGYKHLVDVITGNKSQYVKSYHHDELPVFGVGKEHSSVYWYSIIRQTLLHEYLEKDIETIGLLKLTKAGKDFIKKPVDVYLHSDHEYGEDHEDEESEKDAYDKGYNQDLFDQLKVLRKKVAKEHNFPPWVIFQDPSMEEMATTYPSNEQEMAQINGVGMGKVKKFGRPFLQLIKEFVEVNDITTAHDVLIKSSINKSKLKIFVINQIDKKIDLEEIADAQELTMNEVIKEIENICYSGTKLNLNYYIDHILDDDQQDEIYDYFMESETDDIEQAVDDLGEDGYSEDEVRLMRVKFMSENAN